MIWLRRILAFLADAVTRTEQDDRDGPPPAASIDELRRALERQIAADEKREARRG